MAGRMRSPVVWLFVRTAWNVCASGPVLVTRTYSSFVPPGSRKTNWPAVSPRRLAP